ncbi:MAG: tetratricopeptide repeat protein [Blastocatellia bacterium]|nr:tetratricopeptide repeat protein [Blastocatellia bacterium]
MRFIRSLSISLVLVVLLLHNFHTVESSQKDDFIDIIDYKIEAELLPETNNISANTTVTFRSLRATQSAIFEINGSLKVSKVTSQDGRELQFIQDSLDALNVKVDLGGQVQAGQEVTLNFKYEGKLQTQEGGVLPNKRLAYVGSEGSYLTYASRWFPFHGYASDTATYQVSLIVPSDLTVVGFSFDDKQSRTYEPPPPAVPQPEKQDPTKATPKTNTTRPTKKPIQKSPAKRGGPSVEELENEMSSFAEPQTVATRTIHTFTSKVPILGGTFAIAKYGSKSINSQGLNIDFHFKPGSERFVEKYAEAMSRALNFYSEKFGSYAFGKRLIVAEIDNESLDTYTTAGISLLAEKFFKYGLPDEDLYREVAYQWWGQAVVLRSFDDAWVSQGLAQFSALFLQESETTASAFSEIARQSLERALAFESQTSITRAPAELDDQSEAYRSIVFYKGAFVCRMLKLLVGEEKFGRIMRTYYEQHNGKNAGINDFEKVANQVTGSNLRYFFGQWIDSTGVPEFTSNYQMLKTKDGQFKVRGSIEQNVDSFKMPVDIELLYEGGSERVTLDFDGKSADFNLPSKGKPIDIVIDPDSKILKMSDLIRVSVVVRRGIEHFRKEEYPEAEQQFQAAIKLNRSSSWAWYNLGLLYFAQKNYQKANDAFGEALELDLQPRWVEVWSHIRRGNCYDALGSRERAVAEYNKAVELGDNYDGAQEMAQRYLGSPYKRDENRQSERTSN